MVLGVAFEVHHDHLPPTAKPPYGVSLSPPIHRLVFLPLLKRFPLQLTPCVPTRATLLKSEPGPNQVVLCNPGTFIAHLKGLLWGSNETKFCSVGYIKKCSKMLAVTATNNISGGSKRKTIFVIVLWCYLPFLPCYYLPYWCKSNAG